MNIEPAHEIYGANMTPVKKILVMDYCRDPSRSVDHYEPCLYNPKEGEYIHGEIDEFWEQESPWAFGCFPRWCEDGAFGADYYFFPDEITIVLIPPTEYCERGDRYITWKDETYTTFPEDCERANEKR